MGVVSGRQVAADGPWALVGAGGHARSVADVLARRGQTVALVYAGGVAPSWLAQTARFFGEDEIERGPVDARWLIAIGDVDARARLTERVQRSGHELGVLVGATSTIARDAVLSPGVMVLEHAHVGPGATLGRSAIVNTAAVVEHDCSVGDHCHIAPGARLLGGARIGARVLIGSAATILPSVEILADAVVGAGAVVTESVGPGVTVYGVPARPRG